MLLLTVPMSGSFAWLPLAKVVILRTEVAKTKMPKPKTKVKPTFWDLGRRSDQIMKGRVVRMIMSVEML